MTQPTCRFRPAAPLLAIVLLAASLTVVPAQAQLPAVPDGAALPALPASPVPVPALPGLGLPALPGLSLPTLPPPGFNLPSLGNFTPLFTGLQGGLLQASGGIVPTPGTETFSGSMLWGGLPRNWVGIRPVGAPAGAPVLLLLHPRNLTPARTANLTRAGRLAADFGAWVILPEGINGTWSDEPGTALVDDVGFLDALITRLVGDNGLDADRVYAAGYSKGGYMAELLACERPQQLAGLAMVGATLRNTLAAVCTAPQRMPTLMFNGTADAISPYGDSIGVQGAVATAAYWARKNRCAADAISVTDLPDVDPLDGATVTVSRYTNCDASTVALYTIDNGGHTWPGSPAAQYTAAYGITTKDIDATLELWARLIPYARAGAP